MSTEVHAVAGVYFHRSLCSIVKILEDKKNKKIHCNATLVFPKVSRKSWLVRPLICIFERISGQVLVRRSPLFLSESGINIQKYTHMMSTEPPLLVSCILHILASPLPKCIAEQAEVCLLKTPIPF